MRKPVGEPKNFRIYVIVGRQTALESGFSTVICAPVLTNGLGLSTQVPVGIEEGLKHDSWIICDGLVSVRKSHLTDYVGSLKAQKLLLLNHALRIALDL